VKTLKEANSEYEKSKKQ
jgi:chromosome segregation ATPase